MGLKTILLAGSLFSAGAAQGAAPDDFLFGADLSYVNEMEDCGAVYRDDGKPRDPYALFAAHGNDLVRVRLWVDADWTDYSDLKDVRETIARSRAAGMKVLLDFHYSDEWADGDKQIIPKAWKGIGSTQELAQTLHDYTYDTLTALADAGLMPEMVQVGNETNPEILRGEDNGDEPIDWARNAALFNAGIRAVREAGEATGTAPKVMLHIAQPENVGPWFDAAAQAGITDFDQIGISYYRKWSSETFDGLAAAIDALNRDYPGKDIILVETSYPWTMKSADEAANLLGEDTLIDEYPASVAGQTAYLTDLTQLLIDHHADGIVYWEPAWVSTSCSTRWGQGSHWENATFFDFENGNEALPSIDYMSRDYRVPPD